MENWKRNVSFVLIDTVDAGNIGASARALKNLGFSKLELVRPLRFPSPDAVRLAHGAEDILEEAVIHSGLADCLADKAVVIGTTRRTGKKRGRVLPVREAVGKIRSYAAKNLIAILFGKEDRGLTNDEAAECDLMISIPAEPENPSFNIAQAVLITAYETAFSTLAGVPADEVVTHEELEKLFARIWDALSAAGYEPKGIRDSSEGIRRNLKQLLGRMALSPGEARMLHGILSRLEEAKRK